MAASELTESAKNRLADEANEEQLIQQDIEGYLERHHHKELLRFVAVGSVDDGKSTLIGRLLHDTKGIYEDQLSAVKSASKQHETEIDFSLFTDGLKAEREQGITIDVAYRYFSTDKRKFIIADTPGHVQYTRNMATGASTANVAIILIDARLGVLEQSRRHAYIASLLGIPHLFVCVNKMDLADWSQDVYDRILADFAKVAAQLGFKDVTYIPISALAGSNVVHNSTHMPWYEGKTLIEHLETVPIAADRNLTDFRFPVQFVQRPNLDYRAFSGQIASGVVKQGDEVMVLPGRQTTRVAAIDTFEGELEEAFAPQSVSLRLEDEIDISRGDMLVHVHDQPRSVARFEAMLVWMNDRALDTERSYFIKHTSRYVRANFNAVSWRVDLNTLGQIPASTLDLNDIGRVRVHTTQPIYFDAYAKNRSTGAFIVVDSLTNTTVAAGMIVSHSDSPAGDELGNTGSQVSARERADRLGQEGRLLWLVGSAGPARALAYAMERVLFDRGRIAAVVSSDDDLADKARTPTSVVELARRLKAAGLITIFAGGDEAPDAVSADVALRVDIDKLAISDGDEEARANQLVDELLP